MRRSMMLLCLLLVAVCSLSAQHLVSGVVTDMNGKPLAGAKVDVRLVGASLSISTGVDGKFQLQTVAPVQEVCVMYSGMQTQIQAPAVDMVVRMERISRWRLEPQTYTWIVSPQVVFPESDTSNPAFGLMAAIVKQWGVYVKFVYSPSEKTQGVYTASSGVLPWTTGKDKRSYMSFAAGAMYRLKCPVYAYAGLGFVNRKVAWQLTDGRYVKNKEYSYSGLMADYGLLLQMGQFTVNAGAMMSVSDGVNFAANAGIGYSF